MHRRPRKSFSALIPVSRTGIELKAAPVQGFAVYPWGMNERQLCRAESCIRTAASLKLAIKPVHQQRGGSIIYLPQCTNYIVRARAQKRPGQTHQPFACISAKT